MALKLSRSRNSAATGSCLARVRVRVCSMRSRIRVQLGNPVSASWVARKTSSRWRWASSSWDCWLSSSKSSHIRTRVTSRLRRRICSPRSCSLGSSSSSAAVELSTSAAESRHLRQRLVTWLSVTSPCEARWAKIPQASSPTSRATASPSPAIHRATPTVEAVPNRSKLSSTALSSDGPDAASASSSPQPRRWSARSARCPGAGAQAAPPGPSERPAPELIRLKGIIGAIGAAPRFLIGIRGTSARAGNRAPERPGPSYLPSKVLQTATLCLRHS